MSTSDFEKGSKATTSDEGSNRYSVSEPVYHEYRYRFVIMILYFGISIGNQILWVACAPITTNLIQIYGVSQFIVNLTSSLAMFLYLPATFPANYVLDKFGVKTGLFLGTALSLLGMWIRMFAGISFYFVLLGQIIAGLGTPMIFNCPQKISAFWVSPKKRTTFTAILTTPAAIGIAFGYYLPGLIVGSESSVTKGKELFLRLMLIEAIIATALSAPLFLLFKEKPPTPPSASAGVPRENFVQGIKSLYKNKSFLWLLIIVGLGMGTLNAIQTVIESFVAPFGFSQVNASDLGIIFIMLGLAGSIVLGVLVEKTRKYRLSVGIVNLVGIITLGALIGLVYTQNMVAMSIAIGVFGFFVTALLPLGLEFAAEITFPVGEAMSGGLLISLTQVIGAAQIFIIDGIMTMDNQQKAAIISICMLIGCLVLAVVASIIMKENLVRSKHDENADDICSKTRNANSVYPVVDNQINVPVVNQE